MTALETLSLPVAIEVVYRVGRILAFADGADHMVADLQRRARTDPASAAALEIVGDIEQDTGRPISALSEVEAAARLHPLSAEIGRRLRVETGGDPLTGRRILAEMRSGHPL